MVLFQVGFGNSGICVIRVIRGQSVAAISSSERLPGTRSVSRLVQVIFHHGGHEDHEENKSGTQEPRKGISEIEGKAARVAASESGSRASFNREKGFLR